MISSTSTDEIPSIRAQIQKYRTSGDYASGKSFYESLPAEIQQNKVAALEIAQLYLVQGQYKLAAEACLFAAPPLFNCEAQNDKATREIWDEDHVALEICRAYIEICHSGDLASALKVAEIVRGVWLFSPRKEISDFYRFPKSWCL